MGNEYERKYYNHTISLDIESVPLGQRNMDSVKSKEELYAEVPVSYSKAKQDIWVDKKYQEQLDDVEKEYRSRSFEAMKGRIVCIGIKFDDNETEMIEYCENEKDILIALENKLEEHKQTIHDSLFIGNNIYGFDIRFIIQKAYKYGTKKLLYFLPTNKYDKRIYDLSDKFNIDVYGKHTKLVEICEFLDVKTPKDDLDGSMVLDAFIAGEIDRIQTYCKKDVQSGYECYLKMIL